MRKYSVASSEYDLSYEGGLVKLCNGWSEHHLIKKNPAVLKLKKNRATKLKRKRIGS
ncbi:hypothetical protein LguiB_005332 [Lonicera macranthoides]